MSHSSYALIYSLKNKSKSYSLCRMLTIRKEIKENMMIPENSNNIEIRYSAFVPPEKSP